MSKTKSYLMSVLAVMFLGLTMIGADGCDGQPAAQPTSASGVHKADVKVQTGSDGLTVEQRNVKERLTEDNKIGAIKHLYVMSAYSGQVLIYSTVRGKVTSGGKRLTPTTVNGGHGDQAGWWGGINVNIGGVDYRTNEVLQDDGTYGSSGDYLYWWDTKGVYHQHFVQGGQIVHVSSEPLAVKSVVLNMELTVKPGEQPGAEDALPAPTHAPTHAPPSKK